MWRDRSKFVDAPLLKRVRDMVHRTRTHKPERILPTFVHGDLFPEHIFFDRETQEIRTLIDWADARWGDPAADFVMLGWILGDAFLESAVSTFQPEDPVGFKRRIYRMGSMMGIHDVDIAERGGPNVPLESRIRVLHDRAAEGWLERF